MGVTSQFEGSNFLVFLCHINWQIGVKILEKPTASIFTFFGCHTLKMEAPPSYKCYSLPANQHGITSW